MDEKNKCENCGSESPGTCCGNEEKTENACGTCGHKCKDNGDSECNCNCC